MLLFLFVCLVVCCLVVVARCSLSVVCWLWIVARCSRFVGYCRVLSFVFVLLFVVSCWLVVRFSLVKDSMFVVWCSLCGVCCVGFSV